MNWAQLDERIPWVIPSSGGGLHVQSTVIARSATNGAEIVVRQPGKYWGATRDQDGTSSERRLGGDFVIEVTDPAIGWVRHQFTHPDLFNDLAKKAAADPRFVRETLAPALVQVVAEGTDPTTERFVPGVVGLSLYVLLVAAQCLALCEHRRFMTFEPLGGRALPTRFAIGVVWGLWTEREAEMVVRTGRTGLRYLRKLHGSEPSFSSVLGRPLRSKVCEERRDMRQEDGSTTPPRRPIA